MANFKALRVFKKDKSTEYKFVDLSEDELVNADSLINIEYSSINYKDALAVTGKGKILKTLPLNPGIDLAGSIASSQSSKLKTGQPVVVTGCNLGETFDGGMAEKTKFNSKYIVPLPEGLSSKETMIYGTAGFTAALALERMEHNGQTPEKGPILVTGASGGVGSFAVNFFSKKGYEVHALSGKTQSHDWLKKLGAKKVVTSEQIELGSRPLEKSLYAGAVDNVGGELLSKILAHISLWGNVASIGLAGSHKLDTTVMPFILRGVSLLGTSSNNCTLDLRYKIWKQLGSELKPSNLDDFLSHEITLDQVPEYCEKLINRKISGRILVKVQ